MMARRGLLGALAGGVAVVLGGCGVSGKRASYRVRVKVDLLELARDVWKADTLDIFDRFHIAPTDNATSITLDGRNYSPSIALGNLAQVDVYIGSEANETIIDKTQGHSLIVTGEDAANDNLIERVAA